MTDSKHEIDDEEDFGLFARRWWCHAYLGETATVFRPGGGGTGLLMKAIADQILPRDVGGRVVLLLSKRFRQSEIPARPRQSEIPATSAVERESAVAAEIYLAALDPDVRDAVQKGADSSVWTDGAWEEQLRKRLRRRVPEALLWPNWRSQTSRRRRIPQPIDPLGPSELLEARENLREIELLIEQPVPKRTTEGGLTSREQELLKLLLTIDEGRSNTELAAELDVTPGNLRVISHRLFKKIEGRL